MYEVEYKVEITKEERDRLALLFGSRGFTAKDSIVQNDFYIEAEKSPFGGYDVRRYRDEGFRIFYTQKTWEDNPGGKIRKEMEKEVPRGEFLLEVAKYPDALKIQKERTTYSGFHDGKEVHIDMDSIKFDHSPTIRYFIEAEVLSTDKEGINVLRQSLIAFLKEILQRSEITESAGMFAMAFEKR